MVIINGLSKRFGNRMALDSVSMEIDKGIYGLLGPNGSGKTTLIRCLAGVMKQTSGTISCPENIGYLPQKFGMFKELTVFESMEYFCALKKIPKEGQRAAILDCLEHVRLADRAKDKVGSLSGGMVRRLGIAQTMLGDPELILVDEPTAGLDPEERLRFKNLMRTAFREKTVIISTHIVEDVESICNNIIILDQGKILAQCHTGELREQANGRVFSVPASNQSLLVEPYYIVREELGQDDNVLRVLSAVTQPGALAEPTIEDGYMLHIRRML